MTGIHCYHDRWAALKAGQLAALRGLRPALHAELRSNAHAGPTTATAPPRSWTGGWTTLDTGDRGPAPLVPAARVMSRPLCCLGIRRGLLKSACWAGQHGLRYPNTPSGEGGAAQLIRVGTGGRRRQLRPIRDGRNYDLALLGNGTFPWQSRFTTSSSDTVGHSREMEDPVQVKLNTVSVCATR
jgi:hypothetical protein